MLNLSSTTTLTDSKYIKIPPVFIWFSSPLEQALPWKRCKIEKKKKGNY